MSMSFKVKSIGGRHVCPFIDVVKNQPYSPHKFLALMYT